MEKIRFAGMLTLLGAALGCSVGMLLGILLYRNALAAALLIGAAAGAVFGLLVGIVCIILKESAGRKR